MSTESITAIFVGLVSVIAATGAMVVSVVNGIQARKTAEASKEKMQEVHVLVNSRLSEALEEIKMLRKMVGPHEAEKVEHDARSGKTVESVKSETDKTH